MAIFPPLGRARDRSTTEPTPIQARVLAYVGRYRGIHGYSPTLQEIGDHLGRSKVTVLEHVRALQRKGLVTVPDRHCARQIRLTGRWLPPADTELIEELIDAERRLGALAAACREVLFSARLSLELTRKLEDALRPVEARQSLLPSVA